MVNDINLLCGTLFFRGGGDGKAAGWPTLPAITIPPRYRGGGKIQSRSRDAMASESCNERHESFASK
jgi:hypothetical protein